MDNQLCYVNNTTSLTMDINTMDINTMDINTMDINTMDSSNSFLYFFFQQLFKILFSLSIIVIGFAGSFILISVLIVDPLIRKDLSIIEMYDDLEKQAKKETEFLETNYDIYYDLSNNDISENYDHEYFDMETPSGKVYMSYDTVNSVFNYYCNSKEIPYKYLDCVARNFVIKFDCKNIFIDYQVEMNKIHELKKQELKNKDKNKDINKDINKDKNKDKNNIFAQYKNKNKSKKENIISSIPEKLNVFKYKGKILDYENNALKNHNNIDYDNEYINIDYKTFKNN